MPCHAEVEATQPVAGKTVTTTLQDNGLGAVVGHDGFDGGLENALVGLVCDAVAKREIDGVVLTRSYANIPKFTGSGKVLAIFVKGNGHYAVGGIKSFLDAVTVVNVNVDVQYALLVPQQLDDSEYDIWASLVADQQGGCTTTYR